MIKTLHLFRPLNKKLIDLLSGLPPDDWAKKTVAGTWTVKDVAAHLLDTNIRFISIHRDGAELKPDTPLHSYRDIVDYLNRLNADWVKAMKRMSPQQLVQWLDQSHEAYIAGLEKLDFNAPAMFSVTWAGEEVSTNWFHIARDFTEKWHHQQQIRHAVNQPGILTREFYFPVLSTFMRALPHQYKDVAAARGTRIQITIDSPAGGSWCLEKSEGGWEVIPYVGQNCLAKVEIPVEISWQLFTKAIKYANVKNLIKLEGDESLALPVLQMITVMA